MLVSSLAAVGLLVASEPSVLVHRAMAAMIIGGNGQTPYEPPKPEVVPAPAEAPQATPLPAPLPSIARVPPPKPPAPDGRPRPGTMPAPIAGAPEPPRRLAQAPSNEEILRRLEQLEQENRQLKQQMNSGAGAAPAGTLQPHQIPAQMVPGWRVSLYSWNREGEARGGPLTSFNLRNQRFNATLGQRPLNRSSVRERHQRATDEMFVYRFDGWLHAARAGRYELGFEVTCGFEHPCNLVVKLGGQQLVSIRDKKFNNTLLQTGIDLEAGESYPLEVTFGISQNTYFKFKPMAVTLYPLIRPPGELNFRDFGPGELLTEAKPGVPYGMPPR
ncbi:MAG: hypothetical protein B7X99_06770 [Rhizobiales bacterium 17-65-6]|nr:MAG: hypothetical protein B7X99_06770 [Rhizobiales bacterium 17-65-6]